MNRFRNTVLTAILAVLATLGLVLGVSTPAVAAQGGLQQILVTSSSWSGLGVHFNCGNYGVNPGEKAGEGLYLPLCSGNYDGAREPATVYVGAGWCVSRWLINHTNNIASGKQYLWAGGTGQWFQNWQPAYNSGYTMVYESWWGSWCPTSGSPGFSGVAWAY